MTDQEPTTRLVDTAETLQFAENTCGCGRPARYGIRGELSCNKYSRCPTYAELEERSRALDSLVRAYRGKRAVDGMNGREWDASKHFRAEARIEELETQLKTLKR